MENPIKNSKDFFNQEDYDRLVKEGVTEFAEFSSLPAPDDPDVKPNASTTASSPQTIRYPRPPSSPPIVNPNISPVYSQKGGFSRRHFLLAALAIGATAIGGIAYSSQREPSPIKVTPTSAPNIFQVASTREASKPTMTPVPSTPTLIPKPTPTLIQENELIISEKEIWKTTLGSDVEIKPLPEYLSPQVRRALQTGGFKLVSLPALDIGSKKDLVSLGVSKYLDVLKHDYPGWVQFKESFWEAVRSGDVDFPLSSGRWVAYEDLNRFREYKLSPLAKILDSSARSQQKGASGVEKEVNNKKVQLLEYFGLSNIDTGLLINSGFSKRRVDIQFLEALDWNLIAGREKWKQSQYVDLGEWTNTYRKRGGNLQRVCVGCIYPPSPGQLNASVINFVNDRADGGAPMSRLAVYLGT